MNTNKPDRLASFRAPSWACSRSVTMLTNNEPLYTVDHSTMPPSCLPTNLDRSNLVDITRIGDPWRRYLDTQTGKTHDGAVYAAELQRLVAGG